MNGWNEKIIGTQGEYKAWIKRFSFVEGAIRFRKVYVLEHANPDEHVFTFTVLDEEDDLNKELEASMFT